MKKILLGLVLLSSNATAIPITGGEVIIARQGSRFNFTNDVFSASGRIPSPMVWGNWGILRSPFQSGSQIKIHGIQTGNDLANAYIIMGEDIFDISISDLNAEKGSWIEFNGPSILLNQGALYTSSFSFSGFLCGTVNSGSIPHPCVVDLPELTGFGSVLVSVLEGPSNLFWVDSAIYSFENPIPEPGTLVLLGSGLISLILRKR